MQKTYLSRAASLSLSRSIRSANLFSTMKRVRKICLQINHELTSSSFSCEDIVSPSSLEGFPGSDDGLVYVLLLGMCEVQELLASRGVYSGEGFFVNRLYPLVVAEQKYQQLTTHFRTYLHEQSYRDFNFAKRGDVELRVGGHGVSGSYA